jgi:hypothetical protein
LLSFSLFELDERQFVGLQLHVCLLLIGVEVNLLEDDLLEDAQGLLRGVLWGYGRLPARLHLHLRLLWLLRQFDGVDDAVVLLQGLEEQLSPIL